MASPHSLDRLQDLEPTTAQFRAAVLDGLTLQKNASCLRM